MTHTEAMVKFRRCRNKEKGYKLANNTRLQKRGRAFAVKYHDTDIVMIRPDGTYRLNSGGWRTLTTKERMNRILPCCVSQSKGIWFVGGAFYTDGMLINSNGQAVKKTIPVEKIIKIKARVDRRINKFVKLAGQLCVGYDIGTWESHGKRTVPRPSNEIHLKKLWATIDEIFQFDNLNACSRLIHLATLSRGHVDPRFVWGIARNDYIRGYESRWILDNLRAFFRSRKHFFADMILAGELSVGTM